MPGKKPPMNPLEMAMGSGPVAPKGKKKSAGKKKKKKPSGKMPY